MFLNFDCFVRRRVGYSAFRKGTPQIRGEVRTLYKHANDANSEHRDMARKKLLHWGFNYRRQNSLLAPTMDPLLVDALQQSEVFPSLDWRDRMHALVIFLHRVLWQTMDLVIRSRVLRIALDQRLAFVGKRGFFVDEHVVKPQRTIFSDVGMTATEKMWLIFQLSHVVGWDREDSVFGWDQEMFHPMASAIAQAQLMILAVKGRRSYNKQELQLIFDRGYLAFFSAIERVRELHYNTLVREANDASEPEPKRFKRRQRRASDTDTDDTDEDQAVGGFGYYSHSTHCLTHQHWADQCISSGGFNVNCTQAAEASHKINMHRASRRVRHLDSNRTQTSMLNYLCWDTVFEHLTDMTQTTAKRTRRRTLGLLNTITITVVPDRTRPLQCMAFQRSILHREVRLAGVEFLDLLCVHLGLSKTRNSYKRLNPLRFKFGQKYVREDERIFWATDSTYNIGSSTRSHRRDFLHLQGVLNGHALACETVCFVQVTNAKAVGSVVDTLNLVLVRWLEPHPLAWERDDLGRPLCPGPFGINNCLWTYSRSARPRAALVEPGGTVSRSFTTYQHLFGTTESEQRELWTREQHAYFGLVTPDNILDTMHMCQTFQNGSSKPEDNTWLQTVRMS